MPAPITHPAIDNMLGDIRHMLEQSPPRIMGATVLIMAAIDALGYLDRPAKKDGDPSRDFQNWVSKYFKLGDVTPAEWWAARSAMIHTYGVLVQKHIKGGIPVILVTYGNMDTFFRKQVGPQKIIFIHINSLHRALVAGVDAFLLDSFNDKRRWAVIEPRLNELIQPIKMEPVVSALMMNETPSTNKTPPPKNKENPPMRAAQDLL